MAICLDAFFIADRYDAGGGQDPRSAEWPPHPARVVSALRSVAESEDLPTLRALEKLSPPIIHASEIASQTRSRSYVVTNTVTPKGGNLSHPGRTSGLKTRRSVFPHEPHVQMVWRDDHAVSDEIISNLDRLARRVPYLGRSTSVVLMAVRRTDTVHVPSGLHVYEPTDSRSAGQSLRVSYPGFIDELDALYAEGGPAWQASDGGAAICPYGRTDMRRDDADTTASPFSSAYPDLVVLRFAEDRPSGNLTAQYTAALRSLVMSRTGNPLPPALHGHGLKGQPHVAYLGLPVCGWPHADGHLVGLAVAIPGMEETERRRIIRGIIGSEERAELELRVNGLRSSVKLVYHPTEAHPRSATPRHWTAPSRQWVTATPVALDRYPKDGDLAAAVARSIVLAGLPEPVSVEASTSPLAHGAVQLRPKELPKRAQGRLYCHARVVFPEPVMGPVLVGAGRYFGVGLFTREQYPTPEAAA